MKVICEYCGSYVETDEYSKCPYCGATLGGAVQAEQERLEEQEEIEYQREVEEAAQEAKDNHLSEIITGVASIASAYVASKSAATAASSTSAATTGNVPKPPFKTAGGRPMPPEGRPTSTNHVHQTRNNTSSTDGSFFDGKTKRDAMREHSGHHERTEQGTVRTAGFQPNAPQRDSSGRPSRTAGFGSQGAASGGPGRRPGGAPGGRPSGDHARH